MAHRLALRRARLPAPVLGRRHDARADARARARGVASSRGSRTPRVSELVGADGTHEFPLALLGSATATPRIEPTAAAAGGAVDQRPLEFPLITLAQRAGDGDDLGAPWPARPQHAPPSTTRRDPPARLDAPDGPDADVPAHGVRAHLQPRAACARHPHYVAVHGVDDVEPGIYRWPDAAADRATCARSCSGVCWDQDLGRTRRSWSSARPTSAPSTIATYREAQLAAGIVEGRLHLEAYAHGFGASGMTFLDTEFEPTIGAPLAATAVHLRRRADLPQPARRSARSRRSRSSDRRRSDGPSSRDGERWHEPMSPTGRARSSGALPSTRPW